MVVTQKSQAELEREVNAAERELKQLRSELKARELEKELTRYVEGGDGEGNGEDDDDVDVGFNDEELEAMLDRLADSGESDALTALLRGDATEEVSQEKEKPVDNEETIRAIARYREQISLNEAFTGIALNPPQMLSQSNNINHLLISGSIPSFLNHSFTAEVKLNTETGEVSNLKLRCTIPQLRACISHIQAERSLPLFFQTIRSLNETLQYWNHLRRLLLLRYTRHAISVDTTNIRFVDHNLTFTYGVRWQTEHARLEPTFNLRGRLAGDADAQMTEQYSVQSRTMLESLSVNFVRMVQLGVTVQKALETVLDVFLYTQSTPLSETQIESVKAVTDTSAKDEMVDEKRMEVEAQKRRHKVETRMLRLFHKRGAVTEEQKLDALREVREKHLRKLRHRKKAEKTARLREEKIAEIRERKKEQIREERRQQRLRNRPRLAETENRSRDETEDSERVERETRAADESTNSPAEQDTSRNEDENETENANDTRQGSDAGGSSPERRSNTSRSPSRRRSDAST
ncbi:hypothetical protein E3P99_02324 [Wallemia hederae]|uniref:Uncharacterized protein n=1 Tax=Wallemia hederae TaxID=1540922 RepID=A0A4T0FKK1_9BASI|nr:hypothetical protein E3P99_02324 [Wallemia hederae]